MYQTDNVHSCSLDNLDLFVGHLLYRQWELCELQGFSDIKQAVIYHPSKADWITATRSVYSRYSDENCNPNSVYLIVRSHKHKTVDPITAEVTIVETPLVFIEFGQLQTHITHDGGVLFTATQPYRIVNRTPYLQFRIDIID